MLSGKVSFAPQRQCASRAVRHGRRSSHVAAAQAAKEKIYIGFDKLDTRPREGRQGRFILDDPAKFPQRNELVGGWSGGEVGLKQFVEEVKKAEANPAPYSKLRLSKNPKPIGRGSDAIYLGYGKSDLEARREGEKGRVIKDDARKYPQRDAVTGGFAGGELGLRSFVEVGDVPIADGGKRRRQQQSPLVVAGVVSLTATIGGLLLTEVGQKILGGALGSF